MSTASSSFDVVVIGGSAGAHDALERILPALPAAFPLPIAVVVHVGPAQPMLLPEVLARGAGLALREATDKDRLAPGTVYFAPPDYHLLLERDGTLALSVDAPVHFSRPSIDVLFHSAAASFGPRVLAIVLSGANDDGADGLRRVSASGGVAVVQAPEDARAPAMPRAAIEAARPDLVLTADGIALYLREVSVSVP